MFEGDNFDEIKFDIWNKVVNLDRLSITEVRKMIENGRGDIPLYTSD